MSILEIIVLWIFNSFKWFSCIAGFGLLYFCFSKEKSLDFKRSDTITLLLLAQPLAIVNIFNYYNIEGKMPVIIAAFAVIPGLISLVKSNQNK